VVADAVVHAIAHVELVVRVDPAER